jgi:predicted aspartyl protease
MTAALAWPRLSRTAVLVGAIPIALSLGAGPGRPATLASSFLSQPIGSTGLAEHRPLGGWPPGTVRLKFENLEGAILLSGTVRGVSRDTTGLFLLDTGAGYVALDLPLAQLLELADSSAEIADVVLSHRPIPRLELGALQMDQVGPILTIDGGIIRRVTDRPVLGLLGQGIFADRALVIDYQSGSLVIAPSAAGSSAWLGRQLSPRAISVRFRLKGDGKILVHARVANVLPLKMSPLMTLILDTGATKTVLFERALARKLPVSSRWPRLRGISAPTLMGTDSASILRVPVLEVMGSSGNARQSDTDAAVMETALQAELSEAVGEPVQGLLGYSFLRRFLVAIDYPARTLWLDPLAVGRDQRTYEYSHVGLQIERVAGAARVVGVVTDSPAGRAGITVGDDLVAINGVSTRTLDIVEAARRLEGRPGSRVTLTLRRGDRERAYALVRRRLL